MTLTIYDLAIIGAGPGGYVAAIQAAKLGLSVLLIEREQTLGGTCLNVGCIPSKTLLDSAKLIPTYAAKASLLGLSPLPLKEVSLSSIMEHKNKVVQRLTSGISQLMKKNKIQVMHGHARFKDATHIIVENQDSNEQIVSFKHALIATGSKPKSLPGLSLDQERVMSSTGALSLTKTPKSMIVLGAGVIGLELGSFYASLGTEVRLVEMADQILPGSDSDMATELTRALKKQKLKFHLSSKVEKIMVDEHKVSCHFIDAKGKAGQLEAERLLVAVGRAPNTQGLDLDALGIETEQGGFIKVGQHFETNLPNIFAIGDATQGPMLAHRASEEGFELAEILAGKKETRSTLLLPQVVYTQPESASLGLSEQQAIEQGLPLKIARFPLRTLGRAQASGLLDGSAKVIAHADSGQILGVHLISPTASDSISAAQVAMKANMSADALGRLPFAHPSYSEALKEACLEAGSTGFIHL